MTEFSAPTGDPITQHAEELLQTVGGAASHRRDRGVGDRDAKQLGQRGRGAFLRQELPDVEVEDDPEFEALYELGDLTSLVA